MLVDFQRPSSHIKYLSSLTSNEWIELALSNPIDILIDHAHCERKAAGFAIQLMFRYPSESNLAEVLSPIAREELEHFEKILYFLKDLGHNLKALKPPPYGAELAKNIRKDEPNRMLDSFLIAGLIEARSHERLSLLALNSGEESFKILYESLLESEARHFGVYWKLAQTKFSKNETFKRLEELSKFESEILADTCLMPRVHS
ncbi:putative tRNA-(MS(2)IO(6)A)-hydroxylase [Prochlorococcus marinus str. MIT 9312]|uniref:Putative tRNA-(MS(2)IO(6)A)-hydroxylase n=1 Tax=Prochlorococcus marinus (strain MIT 9312) TaxID=74546 RepID=Q31CF0_PROM9|nr:tRNA-(ms[2]io[6]A)-hydroxylase [Prochlorococcus marinus]ABB49445.1 putative tRNA-(MS(2)IO(6)A)-hydroxylase [Prochlorococcus marinus str. MIT 9312]KGG00776.1 tRNA-(ms(2)io(6)A)-hydroxylase [Prochlorococcus marinus str. MIT 9311]